MARRSRSTAMIAALVALATMGFLHTTGLTFLPPAATALGTRRALLFGAIGASLLGASNPEPSNADQVSQELIDSWKVVNPKKSETARSWSGRYKDPMHPGCKRQISVTNRGLDLFLSDGNPGCLTGDKQKHYVLHTSYEPKKDTLTIDFSRKGGPKAVVAKFEDDGKFGKLVFPDGNKWTRMTPPAPDILEGPGTWLGGGDLAEEKAFTKGKGETSKFMKKADFL